MTVITPGAALPLSAAGLSAVVDRLRVDPPTVWALLGVETSGCGYLADRRPNILYERHLFYRLTRGAFDDEDISAPAQGGYGKQGLAQYDRLERAIALDREAALKSTSWGLGQVLGNNYKEAGYESVEDMVRQMLQSEDCQLAAVCSFIESASLVALLRKRDWAAFARRYNGPAYEKNLYDLRLNAEYVKCACGLVPDLNVRTAQLYLTYLGYHPGPVDGVAGALTRSAVAEFQKRHGLRQTGAIDEAVVSSLSTALHARDRVDTAADTKARSAKRKPTKPRTRAKRRKVAKRAARRA